jgi:UDP-N-acetylglucosamine diphosphorylase / glucose-1-phosphate thymidylyltransferase / UDP-N-acetylgalactosamine diphosphorylase / glucosamine-1-phosphate N-acetyltransferase / galactosamine-1-phosphate N-acetyltransferase
MKAIIPIAGNGTRMYPLGVTTPKCLLKILNKPIIEWTLDSLAANNISEAILVTSAGHFGQLTRDYIEQHFISTNRYEMKISFAIQEQQLGTAHVVQMAKDFFQPGEQFVFLYGDDLYGPATIGQTLSTNELAVIGKKVLDPEKWGIFQTNDQNQLVGVIEKPETFVGDLANIGCMKLDTRVFDLFEQLTVSKRGELELTDSLQLLAQETTIQVLPATDYWLPIGYPWHLLEAVEFFLPQAENSIDGRVEEGVTIKGKLVLPESSSILGGTVIEGNVLVGENTIIGPNARLRGNVAIGSDSLVGFGVEVKNSVIGDGCRLPHLAYLGDSILGNNINIAGGCMIANLRHDKNTIRTPVGGKMVDTMRHKFGCVLGDNVRLGINTSLYPGRKIWPGLTTNPGQVVDKDISD